MIVAALTFLFIQGDWRDAVLPGDWRLLADTPARQVFFRESGRLEMRVETAAGSLYYILNLNCGERTAQAVVIERYQRNNLAGPVAPSPPGVFPMPDGPGSDVELIAGRLCPR